MIELRHPTRSNERHSKQRIKSLSLHAFPVIGRMSVNTVWTNDVLIVLTLNWVDNAATAICVRQRMETILVYSMAHGCRADIEYSFRHAAAAAVGSSRSARIPIKFSRLGIRTDVDSLGRRRGGVGA